MNLDGTYQGRDDDSDTVSVSVYCVEEPTIPPMILAAIPNSSAILTRKIFELAKSKHSSIALEDIVRFAIVPRGSPIRITVRYSSLHPTIVFSGCRSIVLSCGHSD
jgi:hypothetical protein